jgi:hypothetical protein
LGLRRRSPLGPTTRKFQFLRLQNDLVTVDNSGRVKRFVFVVAFVSRKSRSKTKIAGPSVPGRAQRAALFGPPLVLEGENAAAYDELLARIYAAVKPVDIIDEIFISDVVFLEWDVLRWRRLKWTLMQATGIKALERFLVERLESDYALHEEHFKSYLAEILQKNLPKDQVDSAEMLAAECAPNDAHADHKLDEVLHTIGLNAGTVLDDARALKAKELAQDYVRHESDAVTLIHELLTDAGVTMDDFMADALAEKLDDIERIDHLTAIAENRRNASLREIDRRRTALGQTLRRSIQEIEDGEFKVIEPTSSKRKNAA